MKSRTLSMASAVFAAASLLNLHTAPAADDPAWIIPEDVVASSTQANSPAAPHHLIDGSGLDDSSGFSHTNQATAGNVGGTMWTAGYNPTDYNATLTFDLGRETETTGLHIWNANEKSASFDGTSRGVQEFEILAGNDPSSLVSIGKFSLQKASGEPDEKGEAVAFAEPVTSRYLQLKVIGNWQGGDVPSLSEVRVYTGVVPGAVGKPDGVQPPAISSPVPNDAFSGPNIAPVLATASTTQPNSPASPHNLINGSGLTESGGAWFHSNNARADAGSMWNASYNHPDTGSRDLQAWLLFDLGEVKEISGMHVWNANEKTETFDGTGRGLKTFEVLAGPSETELTSVGSFTLQKASGEPEEPGEEVPFDSPVKARFFKLEVLGTWSEGDVPALSEIRFVEPGQTSGKTPAGQPGKPEARYLRAPYPVNPIGQIVPGAENIVFPKDAGVANVTDAPFGAKGDGITDDTDAIQAALSKYPNQGKIIYLPNGVYKISKTLTWPKTDDGRSEKNTILQGQSREGAILLLQDNAEDFQDRRSPRPMIFTGNAPAQRFRNAVRNLTVDTGIGNPGAIGIQFNASNQGTVRDVAIVSGDGHGPIGLDMSYTDEIGPLLVKNVTVRGFEFGVKCAHGINSMTFENLAVKDQARAGVRNEGQTISLRNFRSENSVPALDNQKGFAVVLNGDFTGGANSAAAIENRGGFLLRNIRTSGYSKALSDNRPDAPETAGNTIVQKISSPAINFLSSSNSQEGLNLDVKDTPDVDWGELSDWVSPMAFGGMPNDGKDDSQAIQQAIDSGKGVVYLPNGDWDIGQTIMVRGNVRRIIGCEARLEIAKMDGPGFKIVEGSAPVVSIERFNAGYQPTNAIEHASPRTLILAHSANVNVIKNGPGELYLEDVVSNPKQSWSFKGGNVWAWQFNPENEGTHVVNDGSTLWILGLKTERGGTLIHTKNAGKTEVLGGFSYTTTAGGLAPMFVVEDASLSLTFGEVCFNGDPFKVIVETIRNGQKKSLTIDDPAWKSRRFALFNSF